MELQAYKIITLGSYGVGKTCLLMKATQEENSIPEVYQCTIGVDFKNKLHTKNEINYKFTLWDTAGQERYYHINKLYYKDCDAALLVYDVSNIESFDRINFFYKDFKVNADNECAFLLIGNKIDLDSKRQVSIESGRSLAASLKMPFIECSAYSGENIKEIFDVLIDELQRTKVNYTRDVSSFVVKANKTRGSEVKKCCGS